MADKENQEISETSETIEKTEIVKPVAATQEVAKEPPVKNVYFWLVIGGAVVLAIIIALSIAVWATVRHQQNQQQASSTSSYSTWAPRSSYGTRGSYWSANSQTNGPTTSTTVTTYTYTSGVVTDVSGSTLTIAGNGKSQKVTTNSSTQYVGNTKPAKNDSVTIVGTADSKGNITATQVRVDNE